MIIFDKAMKNYNVKTYDSSFQKWTIITLKTFVRSGLFFINLVRTFLNGLICEARTRAKQSLLRRSWSQYYKEKRQTIGSFYSIFYV